VESFEIWFWKKMEEIIWPDHVRNGVIQRVKGEGDILQEIRRRKADRIGHTLCGNCLIKQAVEWKIEGSGGKKMKKM
jgi:hypothetical protein